MSLPDNFFVSVTIHARQVKLGDGSEHTLHFREVSAFEFRKFFIAEQSQDEDARAGSAARLVASSLCDADGKPTLTVDQALRLKPVIANAIVNAVLEVNGFDPAAGNA